MNADDPAEQETSIRGHPERLLAFSWHGLPARFANAESRAGSPCHINISLRRLMSQNYGRVFTTSTAHFSFIRVHRIPGAVMRDMAVEVR